MATESPHQMSSTTTKSDFGKLPNGKSVEQYTLTNSKGAFCKIMTYGGIITELHVPDKNGKLGDVVLGFDNLDRYLNGHPYFGAITGRFANRIAKGKFTLDGKTYSLAINNGPNHLHGGLKGFDKVVWLATGPKKQGQAFLQLEYTSPDGEENYPGSLHTSVTYTWTDKNELRIDYLATTDKPTILNLTNHSYFNLAGTGDILGHEMMVNATHFTPTDDTLIPTGEFMPVYGTPLDFTNPKCIGEDIQRLESHSHRGYDHNFIVRKDKGVNLAARASEPTTGRVMEVLTDQPGMQLYTGNFLKETPGKAGQVYRKNSGFCLETQHFPDSPNHPNFPSTVLRPGEVYRTTTIYRFSVA